MSATSPSELLTRLVALHPRALQVLRHVAFEGGDVDSLAQKYGIGRPQAQRLLARALEALDAAPLADDDDDQQVAKFLEQNQTLRALQAHADLLLAGLRAAETKEAQSPRRRVEPILRWVAIVIIVALSGYFWWKDREQARVPQKRERLPPAHE